MIRSGSTTASILGTGSELPGDWAPWSAMLNSYRLSLPCHYLGWDARGYQFFSSFCSSLDSSPHNPRSVRMWGSVAISLYFWPAPPPLLFSRNNSEGSGSTRASLGHMICDNTLPASRSPQAPPAHAVVWGSACFFSFLQSLFVYGRLTPRHPHVLRPEIPALEGAGAPSLLWRARFCLDSV